MDLLPGGVEDAGTTVGLHKITTEPMAGSSDGPLVIRLHEANSWKFRAFYPAWRDIKLAQQ